MMITEDPGGETPEAMDQHRIPEGPASRQLHHLWFEVCDTFHHLLMLNAVGARILNQGQPAVLPI